MGSGISRQTDRRRPRCPRSGGSSGRPRLGGVGAVGMNADFDDGRGGKRRKEFYLTNTGLRFTRRQMERLDFKLTKLAALAYDCHGANDWCDGAGDEAALALAQSSAERLVQRLVCSTGMTDPRFATKFLIPLDVSEKKRRRKASNSLHYLVRLDALSTPSVYPDDEDNCVGERFGKPTCILQEGGGADCISDEGAGGRRLPSTPQGFARIRLQGEGVEAWAEFIGQDGYLRSDRMQEHFVHLLTKAASLEASSTIISSPGNEEPFPPPPPPPPPPPFCPLEVDESVLCGSPGKILDPLALHKMIRDLPPSHQIFYGPAKMNLNRFPDPRDFNISIARSSPSVELLVSPLSPTILPSKSLGSGLPAGERDESQQDPPQQTIRVTLTLGIGFDTWPQTADFPYRIPIGHIDALHYYQSALGGFYLVPGKPHHTLRCESPRSAVWLMTSPAVELALLSHWCATQSSPGRSLSAVEALLDGIQGVGPGRRLLGAAISCNKEKQLKLRRVSKDLVHTIHLLHLERESRGVTRPGGVGGDMDSDWNSPGTSVSMQVLLVLDSIVGALRTQRQRHYMFPRCNIVLMSSFPHQKSPQLRESKRWMDRVRKPRPLPNPNNRASNFWQNALILSGNFTPENSSSSSDDEDDFEEEDFLTDAAHVESAVRCLHLVSSPLGDPLEEDKDGEGAEDYQRRIEVEVALTKKWQGTLLSLVPTPMSDNSLSSLPVPSPIPAYIFSSHYLSSLPASAYSTRQLKYIQEVVRHMLRVKQITNQEHQGVSHGVGIMHSGGPVEELAYALTLLLDPLNTNMDSVSLCSPSQRKMRSKWWQRERSKFKDEQGMKRWKGNGNLFSLGKSKESNSGVARSWSEVGHYPGKRMIINKTVHAMIHDPETLAADLSDDNSFAYYLLKWLIRAKREEEKIMQSPGTLRHGIEEGYASSQNSMSLSRWLTLGDKKRIRDGYVVPYLSLLYASSLENGIHLEEYLRNIGETTQELASFGMWCNLIVEEQIFPDEGVFDALSKGWKWAQCILDSSKVMSSSGSLHLVLTPKPSISIRQPFNGPHSKDTSSSMIDQPNYGSSLSLQKSRTAATLPNRTQAAKAKEFLTLRLQRGYSPHENSKTQSRPLHCYLRESNPISIIVGMSNRQGQYRGLGTPVSALIAMHKFSVLQEVSTLLPEDERQQVLDSIHRVSKVTRRRCRPQRRLGNVSGLNYGKYRMKGIEAERHLPEINTLDKIPDGFGTLNNSNDVTVGNTERNAPKSGYQSLEEIDENLADGRGSLQYHCHITMRQQLIQGTQEIGLAHGVRNFAVLSYDLNAEKGTQSETTFAEETEGMGHRISTLSDGSRRSKGEMVTKL